MFIDHLPQGRIGAVALDYPDGAHVDLHLHSQAQFLYAAQGLMRLVTEAGAWVIPPTRAVWIPPGIEHQIFMSGQVQMRTLFIAAEAAPPSLDACCVLAVPPLLRELILRLVALEAGDTDDEHRSLVQRLILHEIAALERMPLHLPMPQDRRLQAICLELLETPESTRTLDDWSLEVGASTRTLSRLFAQELGMSFNDWRQQLRSPKPCRACSPGTACSRSPTTWATAAAAPSAPCSAACWGKPEGIRGQPGVAGDAGEVRRARIEVRATGLDVER